MSCTRAQHLDIATLLASPDAAETIDFVRHCERCEPCATALAEHTRALRRNGSGSRTALITAAAAAGLAAVFLLALWLGRSAGEGDAPAAEPTAERASPAATASAPPAAPAARTGTSDTSETAPTQPVDINSGELRLASGQEVLITASSLPSGDPLVLHLDAPAEALQRETHAVRIIAADGRVLETTAIPASDTHQSARLEIDAGWLTPPGRYVVEIKTSERTPIPLRRYAIEVR